MLKQRIVTAVIALTVLGVVLFLLPPWAAQLAIAVVVIAGAWEWAGFFGVTGSTQRSAYAGLIAVLLAAYVVAFSMYGTAILQAACIWWLVAFIWTFFFPTPIPTALRWICGVLVLVPLFVALTALYALDPELLLFALLIVWAADIGAYFAGRRFGRVKLAPKISPGKTWEGVFGGLAVVAALSVAGAEHRDLSLSVVVPFCLAVAAISIIGDLTVSMFKRTAGVKDSGTLFPGHGGVLDRIDSVAAATPLFAMGVARLGLL